MNLNELARPISFADVVGQNHLFGNNSHFLKIANSNSSLIFYGPSGTGKTTVAKIIAKNSNYNFYELNATQISITDVKKVIEKTNSVFHHGNLLLYLDEIQNFNKRQQQSLLNYLEDGKIKLIASTTENPFYSIYNALISRCLVFEFKPITNDEICRALKRAVTVFNKHNSSKIKIEPNALNKIANNSGGDVRRSINLLQTCLTATKRDYVDLTLTNEVLSCMKFPIGCALNSDAYFDLLSALQKSIRGSDENAALFYLIRILNDSTLLAVCRRLLVIASEDVGLAYPTAIVIVKACVDSAIQIGMPQARIVLSQAVIFMAILPKSNSSYMAMQKAIKLVETTCEFEVPRHLQNVHCDGLFNKKTKSNTQYFYPHDYTNHYVLQQYLPDQLTNTKFFEFADNKFERYAKAYRAKIVKQAKNNK